MKNAFIHLSLLAQVNSAQHESSSVYSNPVFIALLIVIILLLLVIFAFSDMVKAVAFRRKEDEKEKNGSTIGFISKFVLISFSLTSTAHSALAQTSEIPVIATSGGDSYWGLGSLTFYTMLFIIVLEVVVIIQLYSVSMQLIGKLKEKGKLVGAKAKVVEPSLLEKINASVTIEQEADILLDHNYDGIRELDNDLPPWWKYGFYATIVFAFVYLIHFHVSNTGKLQLAEYEDQLTEAKQEMEVYQKKASNLVNEDNATVLTDAASLASGKTIFMDNCAACHGAAGQGTVGPNLTDDYWLHEGGIKHIFKSIKFGWPEKGMKAWQQDLGSKQIHEVASYILSIHGTNPPNAKEKQGELYKEQNDSGSPAVKDSVQVETTKI